MDSVKTIIAIAGLPGSGKTQFAENMAKENGILLIDDPTDWNQIKQILIEYTKDCLIITDPNFCYESIRTIAEKKLNEIGYTVEWIFFENNPEQCQINASFRKEKSVFEDIKFFSKNYKIPDGATIISVWKPNLKQS